MNVRAELSAAFKSGKAFSALQQLVFWVVTLKALQRFYYDIRWRTFLEMFAAIKTNVKRTIFVFLRTVSGKVHKQVAEQVAASVRGIEKGMVKFAPGEKPYVALPRQGLSVDEVKEEIQRYKTKDNTEYLQGRVSGAVYHATGEVLDVATTAMTTFASANVGFVVLFFK